MYNFDNSVITEEVLKELTKKVEQKYLKDTAQDKLENKLCFADGQWNSPPSLNDCLNSNIVTYKLMEELCTQKTRGVQAEENSNPDDERPKYYRVSTIWLKQAAARMPKDGIKSQDLHKTIWPAYLGYSSMESYLNPPKEVYEVFYYSYRRRDIFSFELALNMEEEVGTLKSWMEDPNKDPMLEVKKMHRFGKNLIIDLADKNHSWPFRISLFLGKDLEMNSSKIYPGILNGFDLQEDMISTYVVCVAKEAKDAQKITVRRLLNLLRGYLKLNVGNDQQIDSIEDLNIRGQPMSKFEHLAGKNWLIWGTYRPNEVFQSILEVKEDLNATLKTAQAGDLSEQKVIFDISELNQRIVIQTFPNVVGQRGIICQWKIDDRYLKNNIIQGVFTHGGILNKMPANSGYLVMCPLPDENDNNHPLTGYEVIPEIGINVESELFKKRLKDFPHLNVVYDALRSTQEEAISG